MDNASKRKFRWISSIGKQDGTKAECWTHLAGAPQKTVILTEGPLKADIIHQLTGDTVLAVPGVNSLNHLEEALVYLKEQGTVHIMTAFDMDYLTNPNVENGYPELESEHCELKVSFRSVPMELLEMKIRQLVEERLSIPVSPPPASKEIPTEHVDSVSQDIVDMLDDLELFQI